MELSGFRSPSPEGPAQSDDNLSWPACDDGPGGSYLPPGYWWPGDGPQHGTDLRATGGWGQVTEARARLSPSSSRQKPLASAGKRPGVLRRAWRRFAAGVAAIGAFLAKFGALIVKIKYLSLVLSMFVSVLAYTLLWGWSFAIGFVALMFVHEMGHVVELRRQGIRASLPMFIPFLGAFVNMREIRARAC